MAGIPTIPSFNLGNIVMDTSKLAHLVDWSATIKKFKADGFVSQYKNYPNMSLVSYTRTKLLSSYSINSSGDIVNKKYGYLNVKYYRYPVDRRVVSTVASLEKSKFYDEGIDERLGGGVEKLGGGI